MNSVNITWWYFYVHNGYGEKKEGTIEIQLSCHNLSIHLGPYVLYKVCQNFTLFIFYVEFR